MGENSRKILVIEDDETLGDVIIHKLKSAGYEAELVADGKDGYDRFVEMKPDLLLLDIILPSMNGYEILEARLKDGTVKDIPVIIISNSGQPVEISRAVSLGVKDYLVKANFSPEEVLQKVEEVFAHADGKKAEGSLSGKKVLLVEDEPFLRDLLSMKLSKSGCEILHAHDGGEALEVVQEKHPDLVLLDLVLPTMSGFDVLEKMKKNEGMASIPVVILSNLGQEQDVKKGKELGAVDFLIKANHSIDEVIEKIRGYLAGA